MSDRLILTQELSRLKCPVCGADRPVLTGRYSVEDAARHFCSEIRDAIRNARLRRCIADIWNTEESIVVQCTQCGFGYGVPHIGGDEEFYSILHEESGYPSWRWEYDLAMQLARSHKSSSYCVLDVGAGSGAFLRAMPTGTFRYAVEGSPGARSSLHQKGIRVFRTLIDARSDLAGKVDLITMFQVLEHLADFDLALRSCREALKPNGMLVISVPNGPAMVEQERITGCPDMPPNHINKWTPFSLQIALRRAGFDVVASVDERASIRTVVNAAHLTLRARATKSHSLTAQVYRIKQRRLRALCLAMLAGPAAVSLLPNWRYLIRGGSFAVTARPTISNAA